MMRLRRFRALASRVPDRAVLTCGLLLAAAVVLGERAATNEREYAAVAGAVPSLTAALQESFRQYEVLLQTTRAQVNTALITGAQTRWIPADALEASKRPPGLAGLLVIPGGPPRNAGTADRTRLSLLRTPRAGKGQRGTLSLPIAAEHSGSATTGGGASSGWVVALLDLDLLLKSVANQTGPRLGVQLSQLPARLDDPIPEAPEDQAAGLDYGGARGWVANSVLVVGDQPWLLRWSVPAWVSASPDTYPVRFALGSVAVILLFAAKRRYLPFNRRSGSHCVAGRPEISTERGFSIASEAVSGQHSPKLRWSPAGLRGSVDRVWPRVTMFPQRGP